MAETPKGYDLISSCQHDTSFDREGYLVCSNCGKVLFTQTYEDSDHKNFFNEDYEFISKPEQKINSDFFEKYCTDKLLEMVDRNLISKEVYYYAVDLKVKWAKDKIEKKAFHDVFAIYQSTRELNYPITLEEICSYFQVSMKKISEMERYFKFAKSNSTEVYVYKFCGVFNLSEKDRRQIKEDCIKVENLIDSRPLTIVATVFHLKLAQEKSLKEISGIFAVSSRAISSLAKVILKIISDDSQVK